jgi:hypothetical protein
VFSAVTVMAVNFAQARWCIMDSEEDDANEVDEKNTK